MADIVVDFDGTCVTHDYPAVGKDIGSAKILKGLVNAGHLLILFTMRSGEGLRQAVDWFKKHDIPLYGIQEHPEQKGWTSSPKAYGQLYIDDAALGCPLIYDTSFSDRPFVDWDKVEELLIKDGYL